MIRSGSCGWIGADPGFVQTAWHKRWCSLLRLSTDSQSRPGPSPPGTCAWPHLHNDSITTQNWTEYIWGSNCLFSTVHVPSSIPFRRWEGAPKSCTKWKPFISWRGQEKEVSSKKWIVSGKIIFLWGMEGVCWADYLLSTNWVISDWRVKHHIPGRGWTLQFG